MSEVSPFFRDNSQSKYGKKHGNQSNTIAASTNSPAEGSPLLPFSTQSRFKNHLQSTTEDAERKQSKKKKSILPLVFADQGARISYSQQSASPRQVKENPRKAFRKANQSLKLRLSTTHARNSSYTFIEATSTRWVWFLLLFPIVTIALLYQLHQFIKHKRWTHKITLNNDSELELTSPPIIGRSASIHSQLFTLSELRKVNESLLEPRLPPETISLPVTFHLISHVHLRHPRGHNATIEKSSVIFSQSLDGFLFDYDDSLSVHVFPLPVINIEDHLLHWKSRNTVKNYEVQVLINCSAFNHSISGNPCRNLTEAIIQGYSYTTAYSIATSLEAILLGIVVIVMMVKLVAMTWKTGHQQSEWIVNQLASLMIPKTIFFSPSQFILPEQYYAFFLLLCLFLYLNIFGSLTILFSSATSLQESSMSWIYFCCLMRSMGKYGLWFGVYVMIVGLQYNGNVYEERLKLNEIKSSLFPSSTSPAITTVTPPSLSSSSRYSYDEKVQAIEKLVQWIYEIYLTQAHPRSLQYLDFLLPKLGYLLLSWGIAAGYWLLQLRISPLREYSWVNVWLVTVLEMVFFGWIGLVLLALGETGRQLGRTRYLQSRHRQILYRLIFSQVLMAVSGLLLLCLSNIWFGSYQVQDLTYGLRDYGSVSHFLRFLRVYVFHYGIYEFILSPNALLVSSNEIQLFVTFFIFSLVIAVLPLSKELEEKEMLSFVPFRRQLDVFRRLLSSQSQLPLRQREPFCLELSCFLLEASYQSYFNWQQQQQQQQQQREAQREEEEEEEGPSMDLRQLGLIPQSFFYCSTHSIFGFLSESQYSSDIVIAFRGSTGANLSADFMFSQTSLPKMRRSRDFILSVVRGEGMQTIGAQLEEDQDNYYQYSPEEGLLYSQRSPSSNSHPPIASTSPHTTGTTPDQTDALDCWSQSLSYIPLIKQNFPRVHLGFLQSYQAIREQFLSSVILTLASHYQRRLQSASPRYSPGDLEEVDDVTRPSSDLVLSIAGHSLGGAIANLAALELAINLPLIHKTLLSELSSSSDDSVPLPRIIVYTFGSPRVGNHVFAERLNALVPNHYRIKIDGDLVTMVPKIFGFYQHAGTPVLLDEFEKGNIIIRPTVIEDSFFRRKIGSLMNHSLEKYRLCLEAVFEPQEREEYFNQEYIHQQLL